MSVLLETIRQMVDRVVGARIDYAHAWPCSVTSQSGNLVDIKPDDSRMPPMRGVPIRSGVPGIEVRVKVGARVRCFFDGGDPSRPFVGLWDLPDVESVSIAGGTAPVAREGDLVITGMDPITIGLIASALKADTATGLITPTGPGIAAITTIAMGGVISTGASKTTAG